MKVSKEMYERWGKYAQALLNEHGKTKRDVSTPQFAWDVAHYLDIPKEAYHVGLNDNHIGTALKRIFPDAFKKETTS